MGRWSRSRKKKKEGGENGTHVVDLLAVLLEGQGEAAAGVAEGAVGGIVARVYVCWRQRDEVWGEEGARGSWTPKRCCPQYALLDHDADGEEAVVADDEELHTEEGSDGVGLVQEGGAVLLFLGGGKWAAGGGGGENQANISDWICTKTNPPFQVRTYRQTRRC